MSANKPWVKWALHTILSFMNNDPKEGEKHRRALSSKDFRDSQLFLTLMLILTVVMLVALILLVLFVYSWSKGSYLELRKKLRARADFKIRNKTYRPRVASNEHPLADLETRPRAGSKCLSRGSQGTQCHNEEAPQSDAGHTRCFLKPPEVLTLQTIDGSVKPRMKSRDLLSRQPTRPGSVAFEISISDSARVEEDSLSASINVEAQDPEQDPCGYDSDRSQTEKELAFAVLANLDNYAAVKDLTLAQIKVNYLLDKFTTKYRPSEGQPNCGICFLELKKQEKKCRMKECLHGFHRECLERRFKIQKRNRQCPMCSRPLRLQKVRAR